MESKMSVYTKARKEREDALEEARRLADRIKQAADVLLQSPDKWRFEPTMAPIRERPRRNEPMRVEIDDDLSGDKFIDLTSWPSVEQLKAAQKKCAETQKRVMDAWADLPLDEQASAVPPSPPTRVAIPRGRGPLN